MTYYTAIKEKIEKQKHKIPEKEYRFFQFQRIIRIAQIVEDETKNCEYCCKQVKEIYPLLDNMEKLIHNTSLRKETEKITEQLVKHLRKKHQYYLPYYFTYLYSFLGMTAGVFAGFIAVYADVFDNDVIVMSAAWALGLLSGRIYGSIKDKKQKKTEKQL